MLWLLFPYLAEFSAEAAQTRGRSPTCILMSTDKEEILSFLKWTSDGIQGKSNRWWGNNTKRKKKTHRCRVLKDMKVIVVLYSLGKVNK